MCAAAASGGCSLFHKRTPRPATVTLPPAPQRRTEPQPQLPPPPTNIPPSQPPQPPLRTETEVPPPPERPRTRRTARPAQRPATPAVETASPATATQTPQPDPPARVGPLLSSNDQQRYNSEIEASITFAERNLAEAERKRSAMNQRQQMMAAQARNFLRQAKELRASDLVAARSLADRAAQVSRDLASSLR